ncbi:hypothetical protein FRC11_012866, partial [Ceratobasidium sp. 423]
TNSCSCCHWHWIWDAFECLPRPPRSQVRPSFAFCWCWFEGEGGGGCTGNGSGPGRVYALLLYKNNFCLGALGSTLWLSPYSWSLWSTMWPL